MSEPDPDSVGIFARTFRRDSAADVADAVRAAGFSLVQLNLSSFGLPTIPAEQEQAGLDFAAIREAFGDRGIAIWGVSATYNAIDSDLGRRRRTTRDARALLARVRALGAPFATLCTGTRDPSDMWRAHPDNTGQSAWHDLLTTLAELLPAARAAGIRLGIEPEAANVVADAAAASRLLDQLGQDSEQTGIILDPANLVSAAMVPQQRQILSDAFEQLAQHAVCLHAKDVTESGYAAAGAGLLDYGLIFELRAQLPRPVPVVIQDVTETDSIRVREMLTALMRQHPWRGPR